MNSTMSPRLNSPTDLGTPPSDDGEFISYAPVDGRSFWENVAETRWGQYVTEIERQAIMDGHELSPEAGIALEVGCEGGRWCRLLRHLGWRMIATDVDFDMLRLCRHRDDSICCVQVGAGCERLPIASESIDLLLCIEVPVVDESWFISEARRVLKTGGVFVGSVRNLLSWRGLFVNLKSRVKNEQYYYRSDYLSFRQALHRCGFSITRAQGCCWPPFGRMSDSPWVSLGISLERIARVGRLPAISPWVIFVAQKQRRVDLANVSGSVT